MEQIRGYMRDQSNNPIGILIGIKTNSGILITGAKARVKTDKFNRDAGLYIAYKRAELALDEGRPIKLPASMGEFVDSFADRCRKYFETDNIILPELKTFNASS